PPNATDAVEAARAVDALCDRYEEALQRGEAPQIEAWLPTDGPTRAPALIELAELDLEHRLRAGEAVRAEDYRIRFPELRDEPAARRLDALEQRWRRDKPTKLAETGPDASPASGGLAPAQAFGRYRIVKVLGQGGMGTVYHAHDIQLHRPVALKVMRFGRDDPALIARFFREAQIAAAFTHPHLCPVYDFARQGDVHYLTMPLLGGEPLSAFLKREGRMDPVAAARLTAFTARAVHEAHRAGVIHRDLKPANVMLNERGEPVVMDFGLARRIDPVDARTTAPGALVGTPAYMAPEQIAGGTDAGGPAQDVYSLGVMLYEMLTGELPFGGDVLEVLKSALTGDPEPPSRRRPDLDPRLDRICLTAMSREPSARFPSMEAFAEALETWDQIDHSPPRRWRRATWLAGVAAVLLVILAGAGWWFRQHLAPPSTTSSPVQPGTDGFQAGDGWDGTSHWENSIQKRTIHVKITERTGERFLGIYTVNQGEYIWRIEGTIRPGMVEWRCTEAIHEAEPHPEAVEFGRFTGQVEGNQLNVRYQDNDSVAFLSLKQSK
ncbi:MAG TPA: serine/threonine-protein kinase, partial [Gemmataceae bacterium]|nr:serine/threonine-protein kinase [Gemmataceae bacterium]